MIKCRYGEGNRTEVLSGHRRIGDLRFILVGRMWSAETSTGRLLGFFDGFGDAVDALVADDAGVHYPNIAWEWV